MDKQNKITRYRQLNQTARKGQIVFAGSSLMEMFFRLSSSSRKTICRLWCTTAASAAS